MVWVVGGVFNFFIDATDPNVQADWFITGDGPYATTVSIGGALLLLFLFAAIVQGILSADVSGMLRAIALDLPVSILGMVGLVTLTQALIALTDALSGHLLSIPGHRRVRRGRRFAVNDFRAGPRPPLSCSSSAW
ncbi:hypothetical protein HC251_24915 (plasmid) [Iamia sp. SCSIO 61187]|uniref:hypothetical protein n=1 Tax=Iamia sp. SCSIO 61187 TaxID=2722752 RepID=UPI001C62B3B0|nr:hypothetical protein [Iamia sp. SCSIO 61187]QYG95794.1 hypothetical protein HC251_24915 [Iamia sp. SCSIO 61187]